jgi:hypothetical protein
MSQDFTTAPKSSGLTILWDVIVAPRSAFAALRERPQWLWAFVITSVLGMIGAVLAIPAGQHMMTAMFQQMAQTNPQIAQMTPEKQQQVLGIQLAIQKFTWAYYPVIVLVAALVTALVMLIFNAIGGGDGNFKRFFALAMNIAVIGFGIAYFLVGLIAYLRGPDAFSTPRDLLGAIPSLAWIAPGASAKVASLLGAFNPFTIWSFVLIALGMREAANVKPAMAWIGAVVIVFGGALVGAAFAQ